MTASSEYVRRCFAMLNVAISAYHDGPCIEGTDETGEESSPSRKVMMDGNIILHEGDVNHKKDGILSSKLMACADIMKSPKVQTRLSVESDEGTPPCLLSSQHSNLPTRSSPPVA